jgi:hypothetical protein
LQKPSSAQGTKALSIVPHGWFAPAGVTFTHVFVVPLHERPARASQPVVVALHAVPTVALARRQVPSRAVPVEPRQARPGAQNSRSALLHGCPSVPKARHFCVSEVQKSPGPQPRPPAHESPAAEGGAHWPHSASMPTLQKLL